MKTLNNFFALSILALFAVDLYAQTDERTELNGLLNQFLAGAASDIQVHQKFWADDLIYTSSAGERFGKQKIIEGMQKGSESEKSQEGPSYRAEETDIRLIGSETAVVAFKLIAESDATVTARFFNTGTFVKRDGEWRAVAWQATKIPAPSPAP